MFSWCNDTSPKTPELQNRRTAGGGRTDLRGRCGHDFRDASCRFRPFHLYVVAFEPPEGLQGFQFGITGTETFTQLSAELLGGLIDPAPIESREWIVALAD